MRWIHTAQALFICSIGLAVSSCSSPTPIARFEDGDVFVLEGAKAVQSEQVGDEHIIRYQLTDSYPADATIQALTQRMRDSGWKAIAFDALNPAIPNSFERGWTDFVDESKQPNDYIFQWTGDWQKAEYYSRCTLQYTVQDKATVHVAPLDVSISILPKSAAEAIRATPPPADVPASVADLPENSMQRRSEPVGIVTMDQLLVAKCPSETVLFDVVSIDSEHATYRWKVISPALSEKQGSGMCKVSLVPCQLELGGVALSIAVEPNQRGLSVVLRPECPSTRLPDRFFESTIDASSLAATPNP